MHKTKSIRKGAFILEKGDGYMRGRVKQKQRVWFSEIVESFQGIDSIIRYEKLILKNFTVSQSMGSPNKIASGILPDYERYITSFDREFSKIAKEGMAVWVDVEPQTDIYGNLIMDSDGITPLTPPDYTLKKILDSKNSLIARYGIAKRGDV